MAAVMSLPSFMRMPRQMEWDAALAEGWPGPDGSSSSTDHIMGVRIGVTSPDFEYHGYAANLHDWRYYLGRTYALPARYRHAADVEYRENCIKQIEAALDGRIMIFLGTVRAWVRYYTLRLFGGVAWKA